MDVELYVYDLSRGMARAMSRQFLGVQIDAVYHTAIVIDNIEYFFGAGVQNCYAGQTHHGRPMEIIKLGPTHLPIETILEYLESLKQVYTPESYDLFAHNCNNFSHDFSMFLVGKGIPDHITSLPQRVLDTPFGQMLRPQIEASMRSITQAPVAAPIQHRPQASAQASSKPQTESSSAYGKVLLPTSLSSLQAELGQAKDTCAVIFFTSSTCAPCRIAYPMFDHLAEQHSRALFLKIDINAAQDAAAHYRISATPTFITFSRGGARQDQWSGADPSLLKSNVESLVLSTFPPHPHSQLKLPTLQSCSLKPYTYTKIPPLDKLTAKLGPAAHNAPIAALHTFISARNANPQTAQEVPLPSSLPTLSRTYASEVISLPLETRFAAIDLLRIAMIDPRIGGFLAEQTPSPILQLLQHVNGLTDEEKCPHNLRLVTLHLACNIFTSSLYTKELLRGGTSPTATSPQNENKNKGNAELIPQLVHLLTSSLLDISHPTARVASASLAFNLASANYLLRREGNREGIAESEQVALVAGILEVLPAEANEDASRILLLALGFVVAWSPFMVEGEVKDLCSVLDARGTLAKIGGGQKGLAGEVGRLFA